MEEDLPRIGLKEEDCYDGMCKLPKNSLHYKGSCDNKKERKTGRKWADQEKRSPKKWKRMEEKQTLEISGTYLRDPSLAYQGIM